MYTPPAFVEADLAVVHLLMTAARLATLVTATPEGLMGTPLPLMLEPSEGPYGTLYGHVAKANPQWKAATQGDAMVVFSGPDAYVTPSWYPSKAEHGKVVPTWNYAAVHAYGPAEFFDDEARLRAVVTRLTDLYEQPRTEPWSVTDAPDAFISAQLKGIVGLRLPITRLEGKRKMSQNRPEPDQHGVFNGLMKSDISSDREAAELMPIRDKDVGSA